VARNKPTVQDPRETPQAPVEDATSAVTAPEPTPPASPSLPEDSGDAVRLWGFVRIDH